MDNLLKDNEERKRETMRINMDFWAFLLQVNRGSHSVIQDSVSLLDTQNTESFVYFMRLS